MAREDQEELDDLMHEEASEFTEVIDRLHQWRAPQPAPEATDALVEYLEPFLNDLSLTRWQRLQSWWPWLLLKSQIRIVQSEIWLASAVVMLAGTVVSVASYRPENMLPLVFLAPILSAFGVGLLYDVDVLQMLELEETTPVSTRLLLLARMTLVFSFNLLLGLLGSWLLAIWETDVSLWPLVLTWLVPMTFLSALAFFISVLSSEAFAGGLLSLVLWSVHIFLRFNPMPHPLLQLLQLAGLNTPSYRPILLWVALLLTIVALWMAGLSDRRLRSMVA